MIELLSCAKDIILHTFSTLRDIQIIKHTNNFKSDFQIFGEGRHFLHYNQHDLKLYTFRANEFKLIRKYRKIPKEFSCFACTKSGNPKFAWGTENGKVNCQNCLTPTLVVEKSLSSSGLIKVVDIDYSYCNKYLSVVYDDGRINVFGLQASVKLNELPVDAEHMLTVARFNTSRNINLAVGSYMGKFTVHDLVTEKNIFEACKAHDNFCCDIICPPSHPHSILSAGACTINLYDIRRKHLTGCQRLSYPLSTITMSQCGKYLVAGDKAGEITGFDIRKMVCPLISKCISRNPIIRAAFVRPRNEYETRMSPFEDQAEIENEKPCNSFYSGISNSYPRLTGLFTSFPMLQERQAMALVDPIQMDRHILIQTSKQQQQEVSDELLTECIKKRQKNQLQ